MVNTVSFPIKDKYPKFVDDKTFKWFWEEENIWYDAWVIFNKKIKTINKEERNAKGN